jgi:hypothetical protein
MTYIYNWSGMPQAGVRAHELGHVSGGGVIPSWIGGGGQPDMGDWPPIVDSGPERYSQASIMPLTRFQRGAIPTSGLGPLDSLLDPTNFMIVAGIGAAAWWWWSSKHKPGVGRASGGSGFGGIGRPTRATSGPSGFGPKTKAKEKTRSRARRPKLGAKLKALP